MNARPIGFVILDAALTSPRERLVYVRFGPDGHRQLSAWATAQPCPSTWITNALIKSYQ